MVVVVVAVIEKTLGMDLGRFILLVLLVILGFVVIGICVCTK